MPVRRPHQLFFASTGRGGRGRPVGGRVDDAERVVGDVALLDGRGGGADQANARAEMQVLVVLGVIAAAGTGRCSGVGANTLWIGEPAPLTRLDDTVSPLICTEAPAVTRTPSWPNSGPVVSGNGGGIGVLPPVASQSPSMTVGPPAVGSL